MRVQRPESKEIDKSAVVSHLQSLYGFAPDLEIKSLPGGTESAVWVTQGRDRGWIVKVFGLDVGPIEKIRDETELYRYLNAHGIHVPTVKPTLSNQDVSFINFKDCRFPLIVMRFENLRMCTPLTITREELTRIASETARMHKVLMAYPGKEQLMLKPTPAEVWVNKDEPKSAFEALRQSVHAKEFSKERLEKFAKIDTRMAAYIKSHSPSLPQTETIIHADLALEHAQLLPDGSVYFFDFSDRVWGAVSQELGTFLTMLYQQEDISFQRWEELRKRLFEGYQTISTLTRNDQSAILQKALIRLLGACKYLAVLAKDTPSKHVVNWIRRGYELGEYII
ncbi:MAG TPA: phosphotransferase [Candidatus Bathyarchaeia archaeon]|nr:phosphotransferase [Candidatus Bathyarchaeia archaeon]